MALVKLDVSIASVKAEFVIDDIEGRDYTVGLALQHGLVYYEVPLPTVLMAFAQEARSAFLDIGAHTGLYSLLAATANPTLQVYAFEPLPGICRHFDHNVALNPTLASRIHIFNMALSSRNGAGIINEHIKTDMLPTSSTLERNSHHDPNDTKQVPIDLMTLDSWMGQQAPGAIDFVKMDIEGHEVQALIGAEATIIKHRPMMVVELLVSNYDYINVFLARHNYLDIALYPGEARRLSRARFVGESWNHVLCPVERAWQLAMTCYRIGLPIGAE
jgi:FkbM family methyltransferase